MWMRLGVLQNILELHAEPSLAADAADAWQDTSTLGALAGGCCFDFNQVCLLHAAACVFV